MSQDPVSPAAPNALDAASQPPQRVIVAQPDFWYRVKRYIMVLALIAMGPWFGYDGWKGWPAENQKHDQLQQELATARKEHNDAKVDELNKNPLTSNAPHSELALQIQKVLAFLLPLLGIVMAVWTMRASRGVYRLDGDVLEVPGHPRVKLQDVVEIDRSRWDRKGIAAVYYSRPNGSKGKLIIDDFIYEREPTDKIFERIEKALQS